MKRKIKEEKGEWFGQAFEHFIFMEILAHRSYSELDYDICFWRTKSGLEVDFILGNGEVAVEVSPNSPSPNSPCPFFPHKFVAFYNTLTYNIFGGKMGIMFILDIRKLPKSACLATGGDDQ